MKVVIKINYKEMENLVLLSKNGDENAKEKILSEFTPFIISLCKKSHVTSFDFEDLKQECYKTLFKCVKMYNPNTHRFVAYATNGIKNSMHYLIRTSINRDKRDGKNSLIMDSILETLLSSDTDEVDNIIYKKMCREKLKTSLSHLNPQEKEFIDYVFFKGYSMRKFSQTKEIPYTKALNLRGSSLKKLRDNFN